MSIEKRCWTRGECPEPHVTRNGWDGREYLAHVTYEGAVLATRERNFTDDSDFYAIVWNGERLVTDEYATTRFPTDDNRAYVDATDAVKAAAGDWAVEYMKPIIRERMEADAATVKVGSLVTIREPVSRGPNATAPGATGRVFWLGERRSQYGTWSQGWRAGVNPDDATRPAIWIDAWRLDVTDPEPVEQADVDRYAEHYRTNPVGAILAFAGGPGMVVVR